MIYKSLMLRLGSLLRDADGICVGVNEAEKVSTSSYLKSWDFKTVKLNWQYDVRETDCFFTISSLNGTSITSEVFEEVKVLFTDVALL